MIGTTVLAEKAVSAFQNVKDKFLKMNLISKRSHYLCNINFVTLQEIKTWSQLVNDDHLKSSIPEERDEKAFAVDEEINSKVSLWQDDITRLEIDAIVNAANESLLGGGGVDGCIHKAAGEDLLNECSTLGGCEAGCAKITGGYKLPAKYVIHAVGPREQNAPVLKSTYKSCLDLMLQNQIRTIAFPCISTGIFGYPVEDASHVALLEVRHFLEQNKDQVDRIIFTTFADSDRKIYEDIMLRYFPVK